MLSYVDKATPFSKSRSKDIHMLQLHDKEIRNFSKNGDRKKMIMYKDKTQYKQQTIGEMGRERE